MKKSSSGGSRFVPRRHRNVRKSSVLGLSPTVPPCGGCCSLDTDDVGPEAVEDELIEEGRGISASVQLDNRSLVYIALPRV